MSARSILIDCGSGVRLEQGVPSRMRDGVILYSDHYYPTGTGPFPTLLMRQPYGRDIASTVVYAHPVWFARAGYHVVIQDVRGRGSSEGEFYPFRNEGFDGFDTLAWLCQHPACNGSIGMYGFSYQGSTQLLAAVEDPPGLKAIAPGMTAHDLFEGWFYHHGALRLASTLGWGIQMLKEDARRRKLKEASDNLENAWTNVRAQSLRVPYGKHPVIGAPGLPTYVSDWFNHDRPGSYWQNLDISTRLHRIQLPALHVIGWYDTYLKGSFDCFKLLTKQGTANQYLVAGPWVHIPWGDAAGEGAFGKSALLNTDGLLLRWFNHWLKGTEEFSGEPVVRHFALGSNSWHAASTLEAEISISFYLRSQGNANSRKGDGVLTIDAPIDGEPRDIFVYDPEVPVLAPGGITAAPGVFDQAGLELGNNILIYSTAPLEQNLHLFGCPSVTLHATSSAESTDFTAKLVRVKTDGQCEFICIGIARSTWLFRHSGFQSDKIIMWEFELEPTSCLFAKGEQIRLEIGSSAFPLYDRNPGVLKDPAQCDSWDWRRSTQMILHELGHQSMITLPLARPALN
jgi:putative CocE/NonD family hydrolase